MGSDHCPVYAVLKEKVEVDGKEVDVRDMMSAGLFKDGIRQREWTAKDLLPMSAKLIPEFDRRRSIRDMFTKKPSLPAESSVVTSNGELSQQQQPFSRHEQCGVDSQETGGTNGSSTQYETSKYHEPQQLAEQPGIDMPAFITKSPVKRPAESIASLPQKKSKINGKVAKGQVPKGQSSLKGFFKPKSSTPSRIDSQDEASQQSLEDSTTRICTPSPRLIERSMPDLTFPSPKPAPLVVSEVSSEDKPFVDPIVAKESWSKLLSKRVVPRCEHNEPCISLLTKKPGVNFGRSFFMCPRPLGPSGHKEKNTQWRCGTFIWSSDWTKDAT
jgi:AP endonuclease-2